MAIARFVRGGAILDINTAPYSLGGDFVPPATTMTYNLAAGTSANVYGGADRVSEKAQNIDATISVRVMGPVSTTTNSYINYAIRKLATFIKNPSTQEALYFEWEASGLPVPVWGQFGAPKRYVVVTADISVGTEYSDPDLRTRGVMVSITMSLKPFALGTRQLVAKATGFTYIDRVGSADAAPRGMRICADLIANKMTNPVFSHPTWNTGWTASASITAGRNVNRAFTFTGSESSALLIATADAQTYTQSIAAGNTNKHSFSMLVAKLDGSAVASSDCTIYYGASKSTTFRSIGNGIYLGYSDNIDGIAAATTTGIFVNGVGLYLLAFQMEESAFHTPILYGDMIGCTWSGTAAASTSSASTAGAVKLYVGDANKVIMPEDAWSIHTVWKSDYASTQAGDKYFLGMDASGVNCFYDQSESDITLTDGTNTASTTGLTFAAGDVLEIICTAGASGLALYVKNLTSGTTYSGTNATYDPAGAGGTDVWIGTDSAGANHAQGIFQLFEVYGEALTSTQATALQAAVGPIVTAGICPGSIPVLWTSAGDNVVENGLDSTHNNYAIGMGIPGDMPARTMWMCLGSSVNPNTAWLSNFIVEHFIPPSVSTYSDQSGTVDANSIGGQYLSQSVNTTDVEYLKTITNKAAIRELMGRSGIFLTRFADASGANLTIAGSVTWGGSITGAYTGVTSSATYYLWATKQINIFDQSYLFDGETDLATATIRVYFKRTASGAQNVTVDYLAFLPRPVLKVSSIGPGFVYDSDIAHVTSESAAGAILSVGIPVFGDRFELSPNMYNIISAYLGDGTHAPTITYTMTYTKVYVTPRWGVL